MSRTKFTRQVLDMFLDIFLDIFLEIFLDIFLDIERRQVSRRGDRLRQISVSFTKQLSYINLLPINVYSKKISL